MAGLSLRHICKIYAAKKEFSLIRKKDAEGKRTGDFLAVDDFNMEIEDGEFIVFVGPSGCGKSTTLRMIAGLEDISSGELYIGDRLVNDLEPMERDIAMVFQSYALYPHMTAFENIAFGIKMRKKPVKVLPPDIAEQVKQLKQNLRESTAALKVANRQLKNTEKTLVAVEKRISKAKTAEDEGLYRKESEELNNQLVALRNEIESKKQTVFEIQKEIDEKIAAAPDVLQIDSIKVRELKRVYKNALTDLKYCETPEETEEYSKRAEKIKTELEYYQTTPVPAYVMKHYTRQEIEDKVLSAAKILGIEELLDTKPAAMSGGQRQRIALGRAIVRDPKVFLLDEPLSNLDAKLRTAMRTEIVKLHEELKTTFIYVTHDQVEAMTMGTRIVVMKSGIVQQIDTPTNLFDFPENKFVAGFIGTPQMNFFDVTIKKEGTNIQVQFHNGEIQKYPIAKLRKIDESYLDEKEHQVVLGIRGEHISICETGLTVNINAKEVLGSTTQLFFSLENTENNYVVVLNERNDYQPKQNISVMFKAEHIHLFDGHTEKSIMGKEKGSK